MKAPPGSGLARASAAGAAPRKSAPHMSKPIKLAGGNVQRVRHSVPARGTKPFVAPGGSEVAPQTRSLGATGAALSSVGNTQCGALSER